MAAAAFGIGGKGDSVAQLPLPELVARRQSVFSYLKRSLTGEAHWLNVVRLSEREVEVAVSSIDGITSRTNQWFCLGLSLGKLLDHPRGSMVARATAQLLLEYGHHIERTEKRRREPKSQDEVETEMNLSAAIMVDNLNLAVKPELRRIGRRVNYECFELPRAAMRMELCYSQVVVALLDALVLVYHRFLDDSCQTAVISDAICRIDKIIVENVVERLRDDLALAAAPVLKRELNGFVESLYSDTQLDADGNFICIREQTRRTNVVVGTEAHSSASSLLFDDEELASDDSDDDSDHDDDDRSDTRSAAVDSAKSPAVSSGTPEVSAVGSTPQVRSPASTTKVVAPKVADGDAGSEASGAEERQIAEF